MVAVAHHGRDRAAQRGQQDILDRQPKPAPRVVDLGGLRGGSVDDNLARSPTPGGSATSVVDAGPVAVAVSQPEITAFNDRGMGGECGATLGPLGPRRGNRLQRNLFARQLLPERGEDVGEQDVTRGVVADDRRAG